MTQTTAGAHDRSATGGKDGSATDPPTRRRDPLGTFGDFLPWVLYWILVGNVPFRTSVVLALVAAAAVLALHRATDRRWYTLPVGSFVVFAVLAVLAFVVPDSFLERWLQPLSNLGLFLIVVGGMIAGRPFTLDYARDAVSPEMAASKGFLWMNQRLTAVWAVAFGVMTVSSFVPPIAEGDATIHDGGRMLSIVGYWVVPFATLGVAALVTMLLVKGMQGDESVAQQAGSGLPAVPERPSADGVALVVPEATMADEPLPIRVEGCAEGVDVDVRVTLIDALNRRFRSRATFRAEGSVVDTAVQAPRPDSDWSGADPSASVWSATWAESGREDLFLPPWGPARAVVEADIAGQTLSRTIVRRGLSDDVSIEEVAEVGLVGRAFLPPEGGAPGAVLVGGSEGGVDSMSSMAALLASHGVATLVVGLFGAPGLPDELVEVPLEPIAAGRSWLVGRRAVDEARVGIVGLSRGAEAVLAATALLPDVDPSVVVALSPGAVVWEALDADGIGIGKSSWTVGGQPLPWVSVDDVAVSRDLLHQSARRALHRHLPQRMHLRAAYEGGLTSSGAEPAAIPVERIGAPLVLHVGADDALWPSDGMAQRIIDRRRSAGTEGDEITVHAGAGHLLRFPVVPVRPFELEGMAFGGEPAGHAAAQAAIGADLVRVLGGRPVTVPPRTATG